MLFLIFSSQHLKNVETILDLPTLQNRQQVGWACVVSISLTLCASVSTSSVLRGY